MTTTGPTRRPRPAAPVGPLGAPPAGAPTGSLLVGIDTAQDPASRTETTTGRPVGVLAWAVADARASGRPLHLVTACAPVEPLPPTFGGNATPYDEPDRVEATTALAALVGDLPDGLPRPGTTVATLPGRAAEVLLEASPGAEMLVVGQRRLGALRRWVEGSTSLTVAGLSRVPAVVVPDDWPPPGARDTTDPVTVGVDLHPGDVHAPPTAADDRHLRCLRVDRAGTSVIFAASYAARHGVALRVVCVWDAPDELAWSAARLVEQEDRQAEEIHGWLESLPGLAVGVDVRVDALVGRPSEWLMASAASSSLTVLGRHPGPLGGGGPHLGSTTRALLRHAPGPVAVVPHVER